MARPVDVGWKPANMDTSRTILFAIKRSKYSRFKFLPVLFGHYLLLPVLSACSRPGFSSSFLCGSKIKSLRHLCLPILKLEAYRGLRSLAYVARIRSYWSVRGSRDLYLSRPSDELATVDAMTLVSRSASS